MNHITTLETCVNEHLGPSIEEYTQTLDQFNTALAGYTSKIKPQPITENNKRAMYDALDATHQAITQSKQTLNHIITACTHALVELDAVDGRIPEFYRTINNHVFQLGLQGITKAQVREYLMTHGNETRDVPEGVMTYVVKRPYTSTLMYRSPVGGKQRKSRTFITSKKSTKTRKSRRNNKSNK